ncbi:MAG: ribosomal-processing cysteine protease Prp [Treponema sp.]|nr:ribosomal-processing cysteine protease Prp [Treponema sp.]
MVEIEAVLDSDGILRSCRASGHAGAGRTGNDVVCAAVTVLMRTAIRTLSERGGITIRCEAPEPGFLFLEADYTGEGCDFLSAVGVFLLEGLASVAEEYPEHCSLSIRRT